MTRVFVSIILTFVSVLCLSGNALGQERGFYGNGERHRYEHGGAQYGDPRREFVREMSSSDFDILCSKIKKQSFLDGKLDMIEVASLGCFYTCRQCIEILGIFSFDSDKLKALEFLAPRIVDQRNNYSIIKSFTFSSDQEKAAAIIQGCEENY